MLNTSQSALVENNYATLFFDYINRSLAESLATVRAVTAKLPDEERVPACHVLDFGLRMADAWPQARDLTVAVAPYVERSGQWENWNQQLQRAITVAEQQQDVASKLQLMLLLARIAQRQGRLAETIYYYRRVIRLARQSGHRFEEARACSNLGFLFTETGRFLRAEVLCHHALVIFTDLQSNHGLAHTHNHLGLLYTKQQQYRLAEQHLNQACELWQYMQDNHSLFHGNVNLGLLCIEMDRLDEALKYLNLALQMAEISGEAVGIARIWNIMGRAYWQYREFNLAEGYFWKAQKLFFQISDYVELAKVHHNLGLTYQQVERWQDALYHLELALGLNQTTQYQIGIMQTLVALVAQQADAKRASTPEKYIRMLTDLIAQQHESKFQRAFDDYVTQYCRSFPKSNPEKLLQLVSE